MENSIDKCDKYILQLSLYIDKELSTKEEDELLSHLKTCEHCKSEYDIMNEIVSDLQNMEQEELPENFHEEFMLILKSDNKTIKKENAKMVDFFKLSKKKLNKNFSFGLKNVLSMVGVLAFIMVAVLSANSALNKGDIEMATPYSIEDVQNKKSFMEPETDALPEVAGAPASDSIYEESAQSYSGDTTANEIKYIKNGTINILVDDIDTAVRIISNINGESISSNVSSSGSSSSAFISKQVNINEYNLTLEKLRAIGQVGNFYENTEKIAASILDLQSAKQAKEEQRLKLVSLMSRVETIIDMDYLGNSINDIDRDIASINYKIKTYSDSSTNPIININLSENPKEVFIEDMQQTLGQKLAIAFKQSLDRTIIFFKYLVLDITNIIIQLMALIIVIICAFYFFKKKGRSNLE